MERTDFPLIISPNLGCPEIVSVEGLKNGKTLPLIIAGRYGSSVLPVKKMFDGVFFVRPSDGGSPEIPLYVTDDPREIRDWDLLSEFSDLAATREIINSELHYNVLGEETRYWKISVSIKEGHDGLLRENNGRLLPRLFDLVLLDKSQEWEKVNYHAVQFVPYLKKEVNFIHLTDLHTAKRNDQILGEVLKVRNKRGKREIEEHYINFNDKFREFIRIANDLADQGKLDFIVITGDLVDFAFHGWEDETNPAENNWKNFINIVTGAGKEKLKKNPGLKVAMFTSTGNHDWRLHPYDPNLGDYHRTFGLEKEELKNYQYRSFDSTEYPEDKRAKLARNITGHAFEKLNLDAFTSSDRRQTGLTRVLVSKITDLVLRGMAAFGLGGLGLAGYTSKLEYLWVPLLSAMAWGTKKIVERTTRKVVDFIIDNPLHAEAKALHYYLMHVNPYLDYAFQYGDHSIIVMDTGEDVFIGQLLDGKEIKNIKQMSMEDNILGGSPDSRAFDSEQSYYNWSQIVWLEKVLSVVGNHGADRGNRTFVFVHAPPINPQEGRHFVWDSLWERKREAPKWIAKDECNLTYGSINHYLSQFFYLSMGYRESELVEEKVEPRLGKVDLVFSGHAHQNIEFRIEKEWDGEHEIRIYSDVYSQLMDARNLDKWWEDHSPVIVQTAACGLKGRTAPNPSYFRKVSVNDKGQITDFSVMNSGGVVKF